MKIPTIEAQKLVKSDGFPTDPFQQWLTDLITNMQRDLSDEGVNIPPQTTANINQIAADTNPNSEKRVGTAWLDTDTNELKMKDANGDVRIIPFL